MTRQRHADLQMHADTSDDAHPLHRAQIVHRFRIVVYALLALLLLGAIATVALRIVHAQALKTSNAEQNRQHVMTVFAATNTKAQPVILPGTLQGSEEAPIHARSAGYVLRLSSDIGSRVRKGDLLAELSTPEVDQQLSQAVAARLQIASTVDLAKSSYARWQNLRKIDAVSQQELDERQSTLAQAAANLASADANIVRLRELKAFQRIVAPFSGTITKRNISVGDLVDAGNGGPAKALFTLAQTASLRLYLYVPQAYAQTVHVGGNVDIRQSELSGQIFHGTIARTAGAIDPVNRTLQIEVRLPNADGKLLAGSYVDAALPVVSRQSLMVPTNSLLMRAEGPRIGVVGPDNRIRLHAVTLGADFGQAVEVLGGISATDRLVINPSDSLADGDLVEATASKPKATAAS